MGPMGISKLPLHVLLSASFSRSEDFFLASFFIFISIFVNILCVLGHWYVYNLIVLLVAFVVVANVVTGVALFQSSWLILQ